MFLKKIFPRPRQPYRNIPPKPHHSTDFRINSFPALHRTAAPAAPIISTSANTALSLAKHYPHYLAPLPKGAGLRQGLIVSNTTIIRDTRNVQISQTLSAVKTEGSPPRLSPLPQTPPAPHYPHHKKIRHQLSRQCPIKLLTFLKTVTSPQSSH